MNSSFVLKFSFSVSLIVMSMTISFACSCIWEVPEHFCRTVDENDHIVLAVVTAKPEWFAMDVEVLDNLNLQTNSDTITVLGQDGFNCGEWLEDFIIGDTLVLGIRNGEFYESSGNYAYSWFIGFCGLNYLRYSNGTVVGNVDFDTDSISLERFIDSIMDCIELSSSTDDYELEKDILLSPNPTSDYLNIYIESVSRVEYYFDIIDISGKVVQKDIMMNTSNKIIDINNISSGVYFLRSKNTTEIITKKFIKI